MQPFKTCPYCQSAVHVYASACPHCGHFFAPPPQQRRGLPVSIPAALLACCGMPLIIAVVTFALIFRPEPPKPVTTSDLKSRGITLIAKYKNGVEDGHREQADTDFQTPGEETLKVYNQIACGISKSEIPGNLGTPDDSYIEGRKRFLIIPEHLPTSRYTFRDGYLSILYKNDEVFMVMAVGIPRSAKPEQSQEKPKLQ
jgi:hypothetical protein